MLSLRVRRRAPSSVGRPEDGGLPRRRLRGVAGICRRVDQIGDARLRIIEGDDRGFLLEGDIDLVDTRDLGEACLGRHRAQGAGHVVDLQVDGLVRGQRRAGDRKSTRLNSSHIQKSRMPSSA